MTILDVSHWNYPVPYQAWKDKGFEAIYIKHTEGTTWVDDRRRLHYDATPDWYRGAYHYFRVQWNGATQAQHFWNEIKGRDWDMPPVIDVERTNNTGYSQAVFAARLRNCLLEIESLSGRRPMIYTSQSMWHQLVGSASWASAYDLWTAHYTTYPVPLIPNDWQGKGWKMWQYTSTPLDQSRFAGDFLAWIGKTPTNEPTILAPGDYRVI